MNYKNIFSALLMAAVVGLSACAKKDSDFASKYAKNALGAQAQDPEQAGRALEAANGYMIDIASINLQNQNSFNNNGLITVSNQVIVSQANGPSTYKIVYTDHSYNSPVTGISNVNGVELRITAMCENSACSPYFIMVDAYTNGQPILQLGVKKYFNGSGQDKYQWIEKGQFLQFIYGNNNRDPRGMVGYLNQ